MIYSVLVATLTVLPSPGPPSQRAPNDSAFFEEIVGEWHGEGLLFGQSAEFEMTWEWELNRRFVRLTYSIQGALEMKAIAHYRMRDAETLDGVWLDTRGEILELTATVTGQVLETIWQSPTEGGRTTYERTGTDSLEVRDYVRDGDEWRPFGYVRYARAS